MLSSLADFSLIDYLVAILCLWYWVCLEDVVVDSPTFHSNFCMATHRQVTTISLNASAVYVLLLLKALADFPFINVTIENSLKVNKSPIRVICWVFYFGFSILFLRLSNKQ